MKISREIVPFLWGYDLSKIDPEKDKRLIITKVLNYGDKDATRVIFDMYSIGDIKEAITNPMPGGWNKKSLHYWSLVLGVPAGSQSRKV